MRCLLALSGLFLLYFGAYDPAWGQLVFAGYCAYCVLLCIKVLTRRRMAEPRAQHWVDAAAYAVLAGLTAGAGDVVSLLFVFPIVVASFSRGLGEGLALTVASAGLVAVAALEAVPAFQLLVIGATISYWGSRELAHRARLELLRDVAALVNPRLGLDHSISHGLRRLREYFRADDCVLVCARSASREAVMFRMDAHSAVRPPRPLTHESSQALLALDREASLAWRAHPRSEGDEDDRLRRLANLLDSSAFVTVPFPQADGAAGRLYLTGERCRARARDLHFLREVSAQIAAAVDNLALIDQVMQNAAQLERARISRDIHDTTLQPYIGLKLGLEALARKLPSDSPVAPQLAELLEMSTQVIVDLRGYVARLRGEDAGWPGEHLLSGLREHVGRYRSFYGIDVELRSSASMRVTDRVAGEAYQIVCEALSNIHRHTPAKRAFVELRCQDEHLAIEVGNECAPGADPVAFVPRSIAERAVALGGRAEVLLQRAGHDVVRVAIPL